MFISRNGDKSLEISPHDSSHCKAELRIYIASMIHQGHGKISGYYKLELQTSRRNVRRNGFDIEKEG